MIIHKRRVLTAWIVGGVIYMSQAMEVVADAGVIALPFQAIMGAVFSIFFVAVAYLFGFLLAIPAFYRIWYRNAVFALLLIIAAFAVLFFGASMGITATLHLSDDRIPYQTLHPIAAFSGMLVVVFGALHFPRAKHKQ